MADEPKRPGPKGPRNAHDVETPAYRIIYGVFGSQAEFCRKTGTPPGTAHLWLETGLIPAHRQPKVRAAASAAGVEIPAALFVPDPASRAA